MNDTVQKWTKALENRLFPDLDRLDRYSVLDFVWAMQSSDPGSMIQESKAWFLSADIQKFVPCLQTMKARFPGSVYLKSLSCYNITDEDCKELCDFNEVAKDIGRMSLFSKVSNRFLNL